jgi:hypothetical protein
MDLLLYFGLFRTYIHGKQRLGPLYHEIGSDRPVAGVSTYISWISASVNTSGESRTKLKGRLDVTNQSTKMILTYRYGLLHLRFMY